MKKAVQRRTLFGTGQQDNETSQSRNLSIQQSQGPGREHDGPDQIGFCPLQTESYPTHSELISERNNLIARLHEIDAALAAGDYHT